MNHLILMHMADGLISIPLGIVFFILSAIFFIVSIKNIYDKHDESKIPMMAVMGAFVFAGQMINFTIPATGSSGHIGGGILLCLILGQYPAFLSLCCVLIIQCLFFGDGGLLALGCNIFNMGVLPCFVAYPLIIKPLLKRYMNRKGIMLSSLLGVITGLELGAFFVVIETILSGVTTLSFVPFLSLMLPIHFAIAIVEGVITGAIVLYVYKQSPQMLDCALFEQSYQHLSVKKLVVTFALLSICIGGGLSLYASSHPDGLEWSIEGLLGSSEIEYNDETKKAIKQVQETTSILPDYQFNNSDFPLGTSTAGIVGIAFTLVLVGAIGYCITKKDKHE